MTVANFFALIYGLLDNSAHYFPLPRWGALWCCCAGFTAGFGALVCCCATGLRAGADFGALGCGCDAVCDECDGGADAFDA